MAKYKEIWANIEEVIIKYKYTKMLPSDDEFIREKAREGHALTDKDI